MTNTVPALEANGITVAYQSQSNAAPVLRDLTLRVARGEI